MPGNVQTWGFLDGAALLDIQPKGWKWSPELEPLQTLMANMSAFTVPQFPAYCATLFPGEEYKCWLGQYRMPLIKSVPFFINAPQFDMFELMYDTDNVRARVMDIAACLRADASALFTTLLQYRPNSAGQMAFVEEVSVPVMNIAPPSARADLRALSILLFTVSDGHAGSHRVAAARQRRVLAHLPGALPVRPVDVCGPAVRRHHAGRVTKRLVL